MENLKIKTMWPGVTDNTGKYWEVAMSWAEGECLTSYLNEEVDMLEWGCGGSTLKFAESVKSIDSIEHHLGWYNNIKNIEPPNVSLYHVPINDISMRDKELDESAFTVWKPCIERNNKVRIDNNILFRECRDGRDWHEYINYINFPETLNKKYDVILVDGRARPNCAYKALSLLKEGGIVVLHDFVGTKEQGGRWYYQGILNYYDQIDSGDSLAILKPKPNL
tara:strand:- start:732 stop:1397 length:666 start_codon:yes stop_codon:yes gene_type:complete